MNKNFLHKSLETPAVFNTRLNALLQQERLPPDSIIGSSHGTAVCSDKMLQNLDLLFPDIQLVGTDDSACRNADFALSWGVAQNRRVENVVNVACESSIPLYVLENGFIRSADGWGKGHTEYTQPISFTIDRIPYFDVTSTPSHLEEMLNDKNLVITPEQKERARACIDKIVKNHLTKYNHQPIYEPKIGRDGAKKVLIIDQGYNDASITRGRLSDESFEQMLFTAFDENPDADIIVKTHPDTIRGARSGYYSGLRTGEDLYVKTEPINPISLIKYCDEIYVASSQAGFEALMCGKKVNVFGVPFYAGWGVTNDRQEFPRRTNKRTVEEIFYIAYILYTYYVHPEKRCRCEIEDAMEYLLRKRGEFFEILSALCPNGRW